MRVFYRVVISGSLMSLPTLKERRSVTDGASAGRYRWSENPDSSPTIRTVSVETYQNCTVLPNLVFPLMVEYGIFSKAKILSDSVVCNLYLFFSFCLSLFSLYDLNFGELANLANCVHCFQEELRTTITEYFVYFGNTARTNPPCVKGRFHSVFSRSLESNQRSFNIDQSKCQSV